MIKLTPIRPTPMIKSPIVGVNTPDSGMAESVAGRLMRGVAVGLVVGEVWGVAEGVDSKAGPSAASTVKVRVKVRKIPWVSFQVRVTVCSPGVRSVGGVHCQSPAEFTVTVWVCSV